MGHVGGGGRGLVGPNRGRRLKPRSSDSSDVNINMERLATFEEYGKCRERQRLRADKSGFPNSGIEMLHKSQVEFQRAYDADPPKNESGKEGSWHFLTRR